MTEDEKNMSDEELAKKYNLGRFSLVDARNKGYVIPDMYKSKIRHNEVVGNIQNNDMKIRIPLTEEEENMTLKELSERYGITVSAASYMRTRGYRVDNNPNYISKKSFIDEKRLQNRKFIEEITNIEANSVETILGNPKEQEIIRSIVNEFDIYKYNDKYLVNQRKFKLLNGEELSFGDISIINKLIELKVFRDNNGQLMMLKDDKYIPFRSTYFFGDQHRSLIFKGNSDTNKDRRTTAISLESFSPAIFKKGIFKEEDFNKRVAGSAGYEISGPHERKLSPDIPSVFLTNSISSAKYYIGRENFTGTNTKINHETVRVSILDDETGVVTNTINGKKIILYTFPLINKDEFEKQKEEIINRRNNQNKTDNINLNNYITKKADLKNYLITDYLPKNSNELEIDYVNRISRLSDTTYVLGSFRSFMSETGLAANNYLWREQLVLADALTSVKNKDKIVNFGKNYKKDGLRTFLSIGQGGKEMGDKILTLGEKLPKESVKVLFAKYGEIIDEVDNIGLYIEQSMKGQASPEIINKAKENLFVKGKDLLERNADKAETCNGDECINIGKELEEKLSNIKASLMLFASACKSLSEENLLSIEDLANTELEIVHGGINEKTQEEMKRIFKENRPNYSEKLLEDVSKEFEDALKNPKENQTFYVLRNNKDIASFMRLDELPDGSIYGASFNVRTELRGSSIGTELMKKIVVKESSTKPFKIICYDKNPMLEKYKSEFGFEITGTIENYHDTGEKFYEMVRMPDTTE